MSLHSELFALILTLLGSAVKHETVLSGTGKANIFSANWKLLVNIDYRRICAYKNLPKTFGRFDGGVLIQNIA